MKHLDSLKRWMYLTFVSKYFIEQVRAAQTRGERYADNDVKQLQEKHQEELRKERMESYKEGVKDAKNEMRASWFVDPEEVFTFKPESRVIQLGGEQISNVELKSLKAEAKALDGFSLWHIFNHTIRKAAIDKAVIHSSVDSDQDKNMELLAGKMMIYNLDVLRTIIKKVIDA